MNSGSRATLGLLLGSLILGAAGLGVIGNDALGEAAPEKSGTNAGGAAQEGRAGEEEETATAIFAGGCFWCTEADFEKVPGVETAVSGYIGGSVTNPSYEQVSAGGTGHVEAVRIEYRPERIDYRQLLDVFWHSIDPLARNRQFCDHGPQYRSAIFYLDAEQKRAALESRARLEESGILDAPVQTQINAAGKFWPAEQYHQDYYKKNPLRYRFYRFNCGRDQRLQELWGEAAGRYPSPENP